MSKSEHEITKIMLENIRSNFKGLINENDSELDVDDVNNASGEVSFEEDGDFESTLDTVEMEYYVKDKESFLEKVDNGAEFSNYVIDKESKNVVFSGVLDNKIEWSYSKEGGVQIGTSVGERYIEFSKADLSTLNTLVNYYELWKNDWQDNFNKDAMLKP